MSQEIPMVLLDGKFVAAESIDPAKHRYLGMFRPAINPIANPRTDVYCTCGQILKMRGEETEHYQKGCYDSPQYVTIERQP